MDGWNNYYFPIGGGLFSGAFAVSFREGNEYTYYSEVYYLSLWSYENKETMICVTYMACVDPN